MKVLSEEVELTEEEVMQALTEQGQQLEAMDEKEELEIEYKYNALAYKLISESLIQGKNCYHVKDTLEYLDKRHKILHDQLNNLDNDAK